MRVGPQDERSEEAREDTAQAEQSAPDDRTSRGQSVAEQPSEQGEQQTAPTKAMSFDRAEFEAPATGQPPSGADLQCSSCNAALKDEYYIANDRPLCEGCHRGLKAQLASGGGGSLAAALAWGLGGALLGAGLYYAVSAISGYEIGLVAIVVGILVGKGVRKGAGLRNHWIYRALGLSLTYLAIVSTYMPGVIESLIKPAPSAEVVAGAATTLAAEKTPKAATTADAAVTAADTEPVGQAALAPVAWVIAFLLCLVAPILMLMEGEIMGLIILAIGLWEGYKYSGGPKLSIAGPFKINAASSVQSPTT